MKGALSAANLLVDLVDHCFSLMDEKYENCEKYVTPEFLGNKEYSENRIEGLFEEH